MAWLQLQSPSCGPELELDCVLAGGDRRWPATLLRKGGFGHLSAGWAAVWSLLGSSGREVEVELSRARPGAREVNAAGCEGRG